MGFVVSEVLIVHNYRLWDILRMDETKEESFTNDRHHEDAVKLEFAVTAALQDLRQSTDDSSVNKHNATIKRAIDKLTNKLEVYALLHVL